MTAGAWPIFKRELRAFAQSSSTYVALGLFFLVMGAIYHQILVAFDHDSRLATELGPFASSSDIPNVTVDIIENLFNAMTAMLMLVIPILTMRLVASERSGGTFEVLATSPVSDWGILLGKYFALITVGLVIVALSSIYPLATWYLGAPQQAVPDPAIVFGCWIGLFLIFCAYGAFGLMASSFTRSQVTAAVISLVGLIMWSVLAEFRVPSHALERTLNELSAMRHTENFVAGLLSLKDFAFFALASFLFLFTAARALEARRWRV